MSTLHANKIASRSGLLSGHSSLIGIVELHNRPVVESSFGGVCEWLASSRAPFLHRHLPSEPSFYATEVTGSSQDDPASGLIDTTYTSLQRNDADAAQTQQHGKPQKVSLHYVLSSRSRGIVGARELGLMKPSALLVNTSRGPLVDQAALADALERGSIRGAAMDVFDVEPLPRDSPWRRADYWGRDGRSRVLTTPHMGYVNEDLMNAWYAETAENVERWLDGRELLHRIA